MKINGKTHYLYLWRAVEHEAEVLESYVTERKDHKAALGFFRKIMKPHGKLQIVVTDKLRSFGVALEVIGNASRPLAQ